MKVSIVTVVYNRVGSILKAIASIKSQSYENIEHIVIDGGSTDGTLELLRNNLWPSAILISEPDGGIYDALNKGFSLATGDIIGILHSDDLFSNESTINRVVSAFKDCDCDYVYGDIIMVDKNGSIKRNWRPGSLPSGRIINKQIPHPSLFLSRTLLNKISPPFDSSFKISADLKQQLYFANVLKARGFYLPTPLVIMATGGASTFSFRSYLLGWVESRKAWNDIHGSGGLFYVLRKVLSKIPGIRIAS